MQVGGEALGKEVEASGEKCSWKTWALFFGKFHDLSQGIWSDYLFVIPSVFLLADCGLFILTFDRG